MFVLSVFLCDLSKNIKKTYFCKNMQIKKNLIFIKLKNRTKVIIHRGRQEINFFILKIKFFFGLSLE